MKEKIEQNSPSIESLKDNYNTETLKILFDKHITGVFTNRECTEFKKCWTDILEKVNGFSDDAKHSAYRFLAKYIYYFMSYQQSRNRSADLSDDTFAAIKKEVEHNNQLPFKDILLMAGFMRGFSTNSNTHGNDRNFGQELLGEWQEYLLEHDEEEAAEILENPFNLQGGEEYFIAGRDGLKQAHFKEFKTAKDLLHANINLASGEYMFRDSSNFFGDTEEIKKEKINKFPPGKYLMSIKIPGMSGGDEKMEVEILGNNIDELNEKYGNAWVVNNLWLFSIKVKDNSNGKTGDIFPFDFGSRHIKFESA